MGTRVFHWDPVDDCVLTETDQNGKTIVTYTHEPGQFGPLLSENRDSGWAGMTVADWSTFGVDDWGALLVSNPTEYYHHYDALGSTTFLTDDSGAVTDTFTFDAWGNQVARTGTTATPYQWDGRWGYQNDFSTSTCYIRSRIYCPQIARWLSYDPLAFSLRDPSHLANDTNYTLYVNNRPTYHIDPSGNVIHVFAFEGAGARGGFSPPQVEIYYKPVAERYGIKVEWHYDYQTVLFPVWTGEKANEIVQLAINKEGPKFCCYPRIVLLGYSWGGNTVWQIMDFIHKTSPQTKIDAILTVDPVFGNPAISWTKRGARRFGNFCEWTSFYQTIDDGQLLGFIDVKGDIIDGATNTKLNSALNGPINAHRDIAELPQVIATFKGILDDYTIAQGPSRKSWRGDCRLPTCFNDCKS